MIRTLERLALWGTAVFVTFFGPLEAAHVPDSFEAMVSAANQAGSMREVFFAAIALAVVSASDIFDNLLRHRARISLISEAAAILLTFCYFIFLFIAVADYRGMPHAPQPPDVFQLHVRLIEAVVAAGTLVEVLIGFED